MLSVFQPSMKKYAVIGLFPALLGERIVETSLVCQSERIETFLKSSFVYKITVSTNQRTAMTLG